MTWPHEHRTAGTVSSRAFDPGTGWTLTEARDLLLQGYSAQQIAKLTGYPERMISGGAPRAAAG